MIQKLKDIISLLLLIAFLLTSAAKLGHHHDPFHCTASHQAHFHDHPTAKPVVVLRLSINNLLDIRYIDHLSTLKEVGMLNPGRNIPITVRIPFGINYSQDGSL